MKQLDKTSDQIAEESQRAYPLNLGIEANSQTIWQSGQQNMMRGGLKLARLAGKDAEIRLYPKMLNARITAAEHMTVEAKIFTALYEMGDLTGSGLLRRADLPKPFNLSMTIPRFLDRESGHVVPATGENLASVFPGLFMDDQETQRIKDDLAFSLSGLSTPPDIGLVLETPVIGLQKEGGANIPLSVNSFGKQFGYNLDAREIDISTAIQIAAQKMFPGEPGNPADQGSATMLLTNKTTKNGKRIAVSSAPIQPIFLREVEDEGEAGYALYEAMMNRIRTKTAMAVSTTAVFRQLA